MTTVVLPVGAVAGPVDVEAQIAADPVTAASEPLEMSGLRLVARQGVTAVTGTVRNVRDGR